MLTQIHKLKAFLSQQTASSGRGPCSQSCGRANIEIQMCAARAYAVELNNNKACSAALHENTNPDIFIPSSGARHRPVKTKTSIQGEYVWTKKQKKTTVKETSHISLMHQITLAESILTEEEINSSPPCSQEPHEDNVPDVVLMAALGIRRCHGCKGEILKQHCQPPKDLVFRMQALQIWRQKGCQEWQQCYGNVYFHLKISCLWSHNSQLSIENVTMAADTFSLLSPDHLHFLCRENLLETILQKVKK